MSNINIRDIDELILNAKDYDNGKVYLNELSARVSNYLNNDNQSVDYTELFSRNLSDKDRRFIAYTLLRVYGINPDIFSENTIKHKYILLIERAAPEVINFLRIDEKTGTFKKEEALGNYVKDLERKISDDLDRDFDLQSINNYKKAILSGLNNRNAKALLHDFMDYSAINKSIDLLFSKLQEYIDSDPFNKYTRYRNIHKILDKIISASTELGTKYSIEFGVNPFKKIKEVVERDFSTNPNSKPADLIILKTEKKYPIIPAKKHQLQLRLENKSTGLAYDTKVLIKEVTNIDLIESNNFVGQVKTFSLVNFDYIGNKFSDKIILEGSIDWVNFDGKKCTKEFFIELDSQNSEVDWEDIENTEPYDLEPVTKENEFIGRKKIIENLKKIGKKVNSSYIFGQRRVGKTSIVKTLQSSISFNNTLIIYLEAGDWSSADSPQKSMNDLGRKICLKIKKSQHKFNHLEIPDFEGSFNRITDFLDNVSEIDPDYQILIILDEFDRITSSLLHQGDIAQSFVLTIRSISNRENFGFVLVGGEKMEYILSQWQEFNKFKPIRVDYFDKKSEWDDFKNLIRLPVDGILEISDRAIDYIYQQTSGNPYFTKKICIKLFELMIDNRDSHATEKEAIEATKTARRTSNIAATDFSHFWKDGIKDKQEKEEQISVNRRKVLLAIGQLLSSDNHCSKEAIIDKSMANGLNNLEAEKTLDEFVQRKIISVNNGKYELVVKFFEDWLVSDGLNIIITTFQEEQQIILRKEYEDEVKIKTKELNHLTQGWPSYRGKKISIEEIRTWLEQFGDFEDQRLAFKLIENIRFYKPYELREKMEDLFLEVRKEITRSQKIVFKDIRKLKRDDILVSYLDKSPAKSGPEYAKLFVEVNNIYKDNSTNPDRITRKLEELKQINSIVFIDDFIGSGKSIIENLEPILNEIGALLQKMEIIVIIGVITGFDEGKHRVLNFAKKANVNVKVKILDPLNGSDKCLSEDSLIYPKYIEREKAKRLFENFGINLEKKHPLGFSNCQAAVVFPNTCPNNSLPILWKETNEWKPLFKRG